MWIVEWSSIYNKDKGQFAVGFRFESQAWQIKHALERGFSTNFHYMVKWVEGF